MLTSLGPIGYVIMGMAALVVGLVAVQNFSDGNTGMGIAQVVNLVTIVFSMFNPTCFTGDTEVYTDDGLVCIEDVNVGDEVWAYNPETGETELKEVLNVWVKETDEILHVSTSDGETIDTTTNHPFYVENKGWVAAGDLEIGDTLVTADGDEVEVTDIEIEKLDESILVYNLEVEDFHTYFVGEYGVLVHNYSLVENVGDNKYRVTDWSGYPANQPKPTEDLTVLFDDLYDAYRKGANSANRRLHNRFREWLSGLDIHEILPIKFGGSPTDLNNKIALTRAEHAEFTKFWNKILKDIMKG